jgi:hypothetical protein
LIKLLLLVLILPDPVPPRRYVDAWARRWYAVHSTLHIKRPDHFEHSALLFGVNVKQSPHL